MKSRPLRCLAMSVVSCTFAASAFADGPLDPSFAKGYGIYEYPLSTNYTFGQAVVEDAQNRLITAGIARSDSTAETLAVSRTLSSGELDTGFANRGITSPNFGDYPGSANAVALDSQGRIVVAGDVTLPIGCSGISNFHYVMRLLDGNDASAGSADPSFGGPFTGTAVQRIGDCLHGYVTRGLSVDAEDNILIVTSSWNGSHDTITLARWAADGHADAAFGTDGIVTTEYPDADARGVAITTDSFGRIWLAAEASTMDGQTGLVLRYLANGSIDTAFGHSGIASFPIGATGDLCCIALDDGHVFVAGAEGNSDDTNQIILARLTTDGLFDTSFGKSGMVRLDNGHESSQSLGLTIDPHGRPVIAGSVKNEVGANAALFQFNLDGSLNAAAGYGGMYTLQIGVTDSYASSVLIDAFGRPVLSAFGWDVDRSVPTLVRYDEIFAEGFD